MSDAFDTEAIAQLRNLRESVGRDGDDVFYVNPRGDVPCCRNRHTGHEVVWCGGWDLWRNGTEFVKPNATREEALAWLMTTEAE
jgi:hypothetical protein